MKLKTSNSFQRNIKPVINSNFKEHLRPAYNLFKVRIGN